MKSDPLHLDQQLCFAVYAAAHAFTAAYKPLLGRLGLTYPQYLVLLVLWQHQELTVGEIGARLYLDSGTLTPLLKRLEKAAYVRRTRDPNDERQVRVGLTEEGRKLRERALEVPHGMVCGLGLPLESLEMLRDDVKKLIPLLRDERAFSGRNG